MSSILLGDCLPTLLTLPPALSRLIYIDPPFNTGSPQRRRRVKSCLDSDLGLLRRIIAVHTHPGDTVVNSFAGSGTTGVAASELGREFVLIDNNPDAGAIMQRRMGAEPAPPKPPARIRGTRSTPRAADP